MQGPRRFAPVNLDTPANSQKTDASEKVLLSMLQQSQLHHDSMIGLRHGIPKVSARLRAILKQARCLRRRLRQLDAERVRNSVGVG